MKPFSKFLLLSLMLVCSAFVSLAGGKAVVSVANDGYLNIRSAASTDAGLVGKLYTDGIGAKLLGTQGNWYKVNYYGITGYVDKRFAAIKESSEVKMHGTTKMHADVAASKNVYYVVIGSFTTLEQAKRESENRTEVFLCPVYKVVDKGVTKYRVCCECFFSKEEATAFAREFGPESMWIWPSKGLAKCVYIPETMADPDEAVDFPLMPH